MRRLAAVLITLASVVAAPAAAYAQATITGVVRDTSGAVLPGVTVEAESAALIERVRSVVTDGSGQFRIVDLRPGAYTVTFTLPGFNTLRREGIELTGAFTATINAELVVGALEETITVTGETPLVDLQRATRQDVMNTEMIDGLPTSRLPTHLAVLVPGITAASSIGFNGMGAQDVGGSGGDQSVRLAVHGSRAEDQRISQSGIPVNNSAGSYGTYTPNMGATQEVTIDTAGASAETAEGGVQINLIPREGGNTFAGNVFFTFANESMSWSNFSDDLRKRGLTTANSIKRIADFNPGFGGPIRKDRLWFYGSYKHTIADNYVGGMFVDRNNFNPDVFAYDPDTSQRASNDAVWKVGNARLTWQATQKHKLALAFAKEKQCKCPSFIQPIRSGGIDNRWGWPHHMTTVDWTAPLTNRLLVDAGFFNQYSNWGWYPRGNPDPRTIGFVEQSINLTSKLYLPWYTYSKDRSLRYRAAVSYITGSHAFKVGFSNGIGGVERVSHNVYPMSYRLNNGVPNQLTLYATPFPNLWDLDSELGLYAQDTWTIQRLTLNVGVRYDHYSSHIPEFHVGPALMVPTRNVTIPKQQDVSWHDISPRLGAAYDLLGTGKTAVKASLNRYMLGQTGPFAGTYGAANLVTQTNRSWRDVNGNFWPDCELTAIAGNGECGPMSNRNFGTTVPALNFDPETRTGWGSRGYNWRFSAGVQHEILPRVSVSVDYIRRWYGNFLTTTNLAVEEGDFDPFSILAPADPRLPGGGNHVIDGLFNINPAKFGQVRDFRTFAKNYGDKSEVWQGVDASVTARPRPGVVLSGGLSSGRTALDDCEVVRARPDTAITGSTVRPVSYCRTVTPFLTQVKAFGSVVIPRVDVQLSGTFQSVPGFEIAANHNVANAAITPSLGRPLSGGARNITVNLVEPGTLYGERMNQLDLRVGKILRLGDYRATVNLDIYNVLNSNAVLQESSAYRNWRTPQTILVGRFAKITMQFDF